MFDELSINCVNLYCNIMPYDSFAENVIISVQNYFGESVF